MLTREAGKSFHSALRAVPIVNIVVVLGIDQNYGLGQKISPFIGNAVFVIAVTRYALYGSGHSS